jgi:hypothetical protein
MSVQAKILNVADQMLKLRIGSFIPEGNAARVEFAPGFAEEGTVSFCRRCGDEGFDLMVSLRRAEQRREARIEVSQKGSVTSIEDQSIPILKAEIVDISPSGVGFCVERALEKGSLVSVTTPERYYLGEVRCCAQVCAGVFRIGVQADRVIMCAAAVA